MSSQNSGIHVDSLEQSFAQTPMSQAPMMSSANDTQTSATGNTSPAQQPMDLLSEQHSGAGTTPPAAAQTMDLLSEFVDVPAGPSTAATANKPSSSTSQDDGENDAERSLRELERQALEGLGMGSGSKDDDHHRDKPRPPDSQNSKEFAAGIIPSGEDLGPGSPPAEWWKKIIINYLLRFKYYIESCTKHTYQQRLVNVIYCNIYFLRWFYNLFTYVYTDDNNSNNNNNKHI